jgi:hypothetical protein
MKRTIKQTRLFEREERVIAKAMEFLSDSRSKDKAWADNFEALLKEYVRLSGQSERIVRISDIMQMDLNNMKEKLQEEIGLRKKIEGERNQLILEMRRALADVKKLSGLLPICAACKRVRDDQGYWQQIEAYIRDRSDAEFSHSICPECARKLYPDMSSQE